MVSSSNPNLSASSWHVSENDRALHSDLNRFYHLTFGISLRKNIPVASGSSSNLEALNREVEQVWESLKNRIEREHNQEFSEIYRRAYQKEFEPLLYHTFDPGFHRFIEDLFSSRLYSNGTIKHVVDPSTGDEYFNESKNCIRAKGVGLVFLTALRGLYSFIPMLATRLAAISHGDKPLENLLHILFYWVIIILMLGAALYTVCSPYEGRKLFAKLDRFRESCMPQSKWDLIAPCFQPRKYANGESGPQNAHLFGGSEDVQNAF